MLRRWRSITGARWTIFRWRADAKRHRDAQSRGAELCQNPSAYYVSYHTTAPQSQLASSHNWRSEIGHLQVFHT
jgi:hypothetical protein